MATARSPVTAELLATLTLALPLIGGQLAGMAQSTVDVILAGHLDPLVLSAVSLGASLWSFAVLCAVGLGLALPTLVARLDGAGRRGEVGALFRQALYLAVVVGLVLMVAVRKGGPILVGALGFEPRLVASIDGFLRAVSFGAPAFTLFLACRGLSDGLRMPRVGMAVGLFGVVVLVPLAYALMYGRFGAPAMGATGSGLATALTLWLELGVFTLWLRFSGHYRGIGRGRFAPDPAALGALLRLGVPMASGILLEASLFSASALAIGAFGVTASGSHQVALTAASLSFMVPLGLSTAITIRVGMAAGAGDPVALRRAGLTGMGMALAFETMTCALFLLFPTMIADAFTDVPVVAAGAVKLLRLAGLFQFSDGLQVSTAGALRGMKDVLVPLAITALAYWGVGMVSGLYLAFTLGWQAQGMWTGLIAGLSTAAVLLSWRFLSLSRVA